MRCPGQDTQFWGFDAIFEVECKNCGYMVELFKDEVVRRCIKCGCKVFNPRLNLGCAGHCPHGPHCLNELTSIKVTEKNG